jgi:hypothetical protein
MTFRLVTTSAGSNPLYWDSLQDVLGEANIPIVPDASYMPYRDVVNLANGQKRGMDLPSATWVMTVTGTQKYILREICPGASANVYVETPTNDYDISGDREWIQAAAVMEWHDGEEDIDADITRDLTLTFSHLVEV